MDGWHGMAWIGGCSLQGLVEFESVCRGECIAFDSQADYLYILIRVVNLCGRDIACQYFDMLIGITR